MSSPRQARDVLLPPQGPLGGLPGPFIWDAETARRIPAVERCLSLLCGMVKQMPIDAYRGVTVLPRPRILDRPDPNNARSWFVQVSLEDYLMQGNAISLVTTRDATGWPATVQWLPASWVYIAWSQGAPADYYLLGSLLPRADVIHVKHGVDRWYPAARGQGRRAAFRLA